MRDAIELEWEGVPSVVIIAEPLVGSAEAMKKLSGMPDYPYVVVPYGVGAMSKDEVKQKAKEITPKVISLLTKRQKT